jgi:hypothetical protein
MKNKFIKKPEFNKIIYYLIIISVFVIMYILNSKTILFFDDFSHRQFIDNSHGFFSNISYLLNSVYNFYFDWSGRIVSTLCLRFFLLLDKQIFNIINSLFYVNLGIIIYHLATNDKKPKPCLLLVIYFLMWFCLPAYRETALWLTGSVTYMWMTVIILAFFLPFKALYYGKNIFKSKIFGFVIMFVTGMLAGCAFENGSVTLLAGLAYMGLFMLRNKLKIPIWCYSGFAGSLIGSAILILSPGNFIRANSFNVSFSSRFLNILNIINTQQLFLLLITIIFLIVIILKYYKGKIQIKNPAFMLGVFFVLLSLFTTFSMIVSPYYPSRGSFGSNVILIIAVSVFYNFISENKLDINYTLTNNHFRSYIFKFFKIVAFILFIYSIIITYSQICQVYEGFRNRENYILEQKSKGYKNITVIPIPCFQNRRVLNDGVRLDENAFENKLICQYYGISSIKLTSPQRFSDSSKQRNIFYKLLEKI